MMKKVFCVLVSAAILVSCCGRSERIKPTKNLIVMISDGTSTSLLGATRWYLERLGPAEGQASLAVDPFLCGLVRPCNSNSPIPESSASMSSYMTGQPTNGPRISVYPVSDPEQDIRKTCADSAYQPLTTVLEYAKIKEGKSVGVVATVIFPHATPGATAAHVAARNDYHDIARQMASNAVDVVFAGGSKYADSIVQDILKDKDIPFIKEDVEAFRRADGDKLWATFSSDNMDFEMDRDGDVQPSLTEMTKKAISLLSKNSKGFFLMVEGSQVDVAAHSNDAVAAITDFIEFNNAVQAAIDFAREDGNTTVIVTSDHGNAGITLGDALYMDAKSKGLDSAFFMMPQFKASSKKIADEINANPTDKAVEIFQSYTGIELNTDQARSLRMARGMVETDYMLVAAGMNIQSQVTKLMNSRTHMGYVSGGHTGEDVFLAVYNPKDQRPLGLVRNIDLNHYMRAVLGNAAKESSRPVAGQADFDALTDEIYIKHNLLLEGHEFTIEGRDPITNVPPQGPPPGGPRSSAKATGGIPPQGPPPGDMMQGAKTDGVALVVDGGSVRIPANRSHIEVNGEKVQLSSVSVYIRENNTFYLSREILKYL